MIKIPPKKRKRRLLLILVVLFIAGGVDLYFLINLFNIFDITHYKTNGNFSIDYDQGFGGINVDFRMTHSRFAQFDSILIFQTISSEKVEEIGITEVSYYIYIDAELIWYNDLDYTEPVIYEYDSFVLSGIHLHDNITCTGEIDAKFNVEGIVQNENINFALSIVMPVNPLDIREGLYWNLIMIEYVLGAIFVVLIGFIFKTTQTLRREARYTEEEKKRDDAFWEYVDEKLKKFKKDTS